MGGGGFFYLMKNLELSSFFGVIIVKSQNQNKTMKQIKRIRL